MPSVFVRFLYFVLPYKICKCITIVSSTFRCNLIIKSIFYFDNQIIYVLFSVLFNIIYCVVDVRVTSRHLLGPETEKSKTFRIAVFIAQKLSGQGKSA